MTVKYTPGQVFRPGTTEPTEMYVSRDALERALRDSLDSDQISILIGGSGSGKSWLCRKFLSDNQAKHSILTISTGYTTPIRELIEQELARLHIPKKHSQKSAVGLSGLLGFLSARTEVSQKFRNEEVFLILARALRQSAGSKPAYILIENAEQGLSDPTGSFLTEISNMILLANSDEVVKLKVRLIIITADDSLRTRLSKTKNSEPIMRRLRPLPEVNSFSANEARDFVMRGFTQRLNMKIRDFEDLMSSCADATDLRPDFLTDYCLIIANLALSNNLEVDEKVIADAQEEWASGKLYPYIERIAAFMNKRDTKKRVRDKILYLLSQSSANQGLTTINILDRLKKAFPSEKFQANEVTTAMNVLCSPEGENAPLFRKFGKEDNPFYAFEGAIERVSTYFLLKRRGDEIVRAHGPDL